MPRHYQNLADYAAIGIAPLLIWWMLNSLANFFMIVIYQGAYPGRVSWILMCYTMGATALARVTIEESRERAGVYAVALGTATFFVMTRFLQDPIFSLAVILTIGYLADRIVHDCTIIDDGVDSSGQGLIDGARNWFQKRSPPSLASAEPSSGWQPRDPKGKAGHQPGRTVLYLAVGALPLFGIGQFFLGHAHGSWERAKWMLVLYLFTSLSLLVVTSFLNLRRYLRQRSTEMSFQVTLAWLAGGVGMIFLILLIAYVAPVPGQTLVSWRVPDFLSESDSTMANRMGWGDEGAHQTDDQTPATAAPRADAQKPEGAPQRDSTNQPDAKPGGESGNRDDGPVGKESGGKKPADSSQPSGKSEKSEPAPQPGEAGKSSQPNQAENADKSQGRPPPDAHENSSQSNEKPGDTHQSPPATPAESSEANDQPGKAEPDGAEPDAAEPNDAESDNAETETTNASETKPSPSNSADSEPPKPASPPPPSPPGMGPTGGLIKLILIVVLLAIIVFYVYRYHAAWLAWLHGWLTGRDDIQPATPQRPKRKLSGPSARPFSSFTNPVGTAEAGQVVVVTFQALEAWGREQGVQRGNDETPSEYVRRLAAQFPALQQPAWRVVDAYNRVVYGRTAANRTDVNAASSVWQVMRPQL